MFKKFISKRLNKKLEMKRVFFNYNDKVNKMKLKELETVEQINSKKTHLTMSKILILFILINCSIIELIVVIVMIVTKNTDAIITLALTVIGQSISFAIYATKAYIETKTEKELDFEKEKLDYQKIVDALKENIVTSIDNGYSSVTDEMLQNAYEPLDEYSEDGDG